MMNDRKHTQNQILADKEHQENLLAANDAFVAAMNRAVRRGKEKARFGTTVDTSPWYGAKRFMPESPFSSCGSPSASCAEVADPLAIGTQSFR